MVATYCGAAATSALLAILFWRTSRLEGWRHYRHVAAVAGLSALYSVISAIDSIPTETPDLHLWSARLNLALASFLPIGWCLFDAEADGRPLRRAEKRLSFFLLLGAAFSLIPGLATRELQTLRVGSSLQLASMTLFAKLVIALVMASLLAIAWRYLRRAQGSERASSWLRFAAAMTYVLALLEDGFVVTELIGWPLFGAPIIAIGNLFMTFSLGIEVSQNARRVDRLNRDLEGLIAERSTELLNARDALLSSERGSGLGQLAAGVGHEINNPLSYVNGNLDYLRQVVLENESADPELRREALQAIGEALEGVERVSRVVKNLSLYARSAAGAENTDLGEAVDLVLRIIRPRTRFSMDVVLDIPSLPAAAVAPSRLVQLLVGLLLHLETLCSNTGASCHLLIRGSQHLTNLRLDLIALSGSELLDELEQATNGSGGAGGSPEPGLYLLRSELSTIGGSLLLEHDASEHRIRINLPISAELKTSISDAISSSDSEMDFLGEGPT